MGLDASPQCTMDDLEIPPAHFEPAISKEVGGWLLAFCIILTIATPAQFGYEIFVNVIPKLTRSDDVRLTVLGIVYCVMLGTLGACSARAGFSLWTVKPRAVASARRFLWAFLFSNFAYFCFWVLLMKPRQASRLAAMGWYHVVGPVGFFWLWFVYLEHSKRVRETYGQ
jgi:hypothetical protein